MKKVVMLLLLFLCFAFNTYAENFTLSSPDFQNGDYLPTWCATPVAGGKNVSPELKWQNPPAGTKSFALAVIDEHPVANRWVHWIIINIPKNVNHLSKGASRKNIPQGAKELFNSYGFLGYGGPQPPPGTGTHKYVFTLYALSVSQVSMPNKITAEEFEQKIAPYVLKKTTLIGLFER